MSDQTCWESLVEWDSLPGDKRKSRIHSGTCWTEWRSCPFFCQDKRTILLFSCEAEWAFVLSEKIGFSLVVDEKC